MLALRIDEALMKHIDALAEIKHSTRSAIIREAIIRFIEDEEDVALALKAKQKMKSKKSIVQIMKELGLDN